jgi:hypothetical protein
MTKELKGIEALASKKERRESISLCLSLTPPKYLVEETVLLYLSGRVFNAATTL